LIEYPVNQWRRWRRQVVDARGQVGRPALIDLVDAARDGDVEAATSMVAICRPELLRLARSGNPAGAEQLVDGLLIDFIGQLPNVHFGGTAEVWTHLYRHCRELMGSAPVDQRPEATDPVDPIEADRVEVDLFPAPTVLSVLATDALLAGDPLPAGDLPGDLPGHLPDDRLDEIPLVVQPTFREPAPVPSITDRVQERALDAFDALWARRSGIGGGLVMASVLALALVVTPRLGGSDPLDDVAFATPEPGPEQTIGEQPNRVSPRQPDEDGRRTVFEWPTESTASPDADPAGPTSSPNDGNEGGSTSTTVDGRPTSSTTIAAGPSSTGSGSSTTGRVTPTITPTSLGTTQPSPSTSGPSTTVGRPTSSTSTLRSTSTTRRPPPSTTTTAVAVAYTCGSLKGTVTQLEAAGFQVTIGTAGDDIIDLRDATGPQFVRGEGGGDRIWTGGSADVICGGGGADIIDAGSGDDVINGGSGIDELYGRAGADVLSGGVGSDSIFGGSGADTIRGGEGDDLLVGGRGIDTFDPGSGRDQVDRDADDI